MGVWIEICKFNDSILTDEVTPFVGVWIEISPQNTRHHPR